MRFSELWRTSTFRLTLLYGLVFALGTVALLGMVYWQSAVYMTRRVDGILSVEADALVTSPPKELSQRIDDALAVDADRINVFALFTARGVRMTGNLRAVPPALKVGGRPVETPPSADFPANARLIARRLPSGEELVVGRDVNQLREIRAIIASALIWSGVWILIVGLACGIALSLRPLRRLRLLQAAGQDIAAGDLQRRMPVSVRHDELDMFASTVNFMMSEVERLMAEVKASTETIAHDLRTPLTRARAQLHRLRQAPILAAGDIEQVIAEIDEVLERFRALLRISELETSDRHAGFARTHLADILDRVAELYEPLAEAGEIRLTVMHDQDPAIDADPKLLFEAVSNLVDNAIKFSRPGGVVTLRIGGGATAPEIVVQDAGPGIAVGERTAVLTRFYRCERDRLSPGSGLGLSIVAAIVRLHRFELILDDAGPGLRATIRCQMKSVAGQGSASPILRPA